MVTMADKESENMGHQVFISYATEKGDSTESDSDRQIADLVYSRLKAENIRCWIAHEDIKGGKNWPDEISKAITQSRVIIVVLSSNSNKSRYVSMEVAQATNEDKIIIPFFIEDFSLRAGLKLMLGNYQWINAYPRPQKHLDKLVETVRGHFGIETEKPTKIVKEQSEAIKKPIKNEVKRKEKRYFHRKWVLSIASIIVLFVIALLLKDYLIIKKPEKIPDDVKAVKSKAIKVEKNKKGLWEAYYQDEIVMVYIPPRQFTMGSTDYGDEKPPHNVYLDGYWMGKTEVTVGQFRIFINDNGYMTEAGKSGGAYVYVKGSWQKENDANWKNPYFSQDDKHPVVCVSWNDANAYCDWLSKKIGLKFKLPTEAQWEKAARGTDGLKYPWGNSPPSGDKVNFADKQAWEKHKFDWADKDIDDGYAYTSPVGTYPHGASPYGLLDMAGNVWEWCADWFDKDYYKNSSDKNPMGPKSGPYRVLRSGGWYINAQFIRCAYRNFYDPSYRDSDVGFRLCQDKN